MKNNYSQIEDNINNIKLLHKNTSNIGGIDKLKIEVEFPNKRNNINILLDSIKSFGEIKKVSDLFDSNIQFDE